MPTARRSMPTLNAIVNYWRQDEYATFPKIRAYWIGWAEPFCFRCGWITPSPAPYASTSWSTATGWLERAHLQDRCSGGSDEASNIIPLCGMCHRAMPEYEKEEDRERALAWIRAGQAIPLDTLWQIATDAAWSNENWRPFPGINAVRRLRHYVGEVVRSEK